MITEGEVRKVASAVVPFMKRKADGEVFVNAGATAMTRFANNAISQNVAKSDVEIVVRALLGKRSGTAEVNQLNADAIKAAFLRAVETAKQGKPDADALPLVGRKTYTPIENYVDTTSSAGPGKRVKIISRIVKKFKPRGVMASGTFANGSSAIALFNTAGLFACQRNTSAELDLTGLYKDGAGWAMDSNPDIALIDVDRTADLAMTKALKSASPGTISAGDYTVILEYGAVCEFLEFLGWVGFGGLAYNENRSFMSGNLGKKVMGGNITITDDAYHPLMRGLPFDFEGVPRRRVTLVEKGVARGVVHDRITAKKAKTTGSGHSLPQPNAMGPLPLNLMIAPGDSSLDKMIASTERGIYVTKFHYTNVIDAKKMILTGMTRNGTFLIEKGKLTRPLKNMRFTESVLNAFKNVEAISRETKFVSAFFGGGFVVPAMKINNFTFSSETKF